jgi:catechol 2,3-dioxygenase-like lactoylglutathione lyase family enzyme
MVRLTVYGFNHTAFIVTDLNRPIAFFRELLGFELASQAPRDPAAIRQITGLEGADIEVALLRGYGHWIELIHYKAPTERAKGPPKFWDDGAAHIALDIDDVQQAVDLAAAYGLERVGEIVTIDQGPNAGRKVVYLQSPDGLSVEFIEAATTA